FWRFHQRTGDYICGFLPCLIMARMLPPQAHGTLLHYGQYQRGPDNKNRRSVSYMAIVFTGQEKL
ncbi:MAG: hypothetical protein ACRD3W_07800, partial [Terriglobales bacterium]